MSLGVLLVRRRIILAIISSRAQASDHLIVQIMVLLDIPRPRSVCLSFVVNVHPLVCMVIPWCPWACLIASLHIPKGACLSLSVVFIPQGANHPWVCVGRWRTYIARSPF